MLALQVQWEQGQEQVLQMQPQAIGKEGRDHAHRSGQGFEASQGRASSRSMSRSDSRLRT
jgi:hypothetical protein